MACQSRMAPRFRWGRVSLTTLVMVGAVSASASR